MGKDCIDWVKWAPWKWDQDAEDEGDLPEGIPLEEQEDLKGGDRVAFVDIRTDLLRTFP